jgi:hypothetical protein
MSAHIIPRYNPRSFDATVTGVVDLPAAVHLVEYLDVARCYYGYARVMIDVSHARWRTRAVNHVGAALRAAQAAGVEIDLRAPEPVRRRLLTGEQAGATVVRPRRVGFRV